MFIYKVVFFYAGFTMGQLPQKEECRLFTTDYLFTLGLSDRAKYIKAKTSLVNLQSLYSTWNLKKDII